MDFHLKLKKRKCLLSDWNKMGEIGVQPQYCWTGLLFHFKPLKILLNTGSLSFLDP